MYDPTLIPSRALGTFLGSCGSLTTEHGTTTHGPPLNCTRRLNHSRHFSLYFLLNQLAFLDIAIHDVQIYHI
jgi:hypothetical protein